MPAQHNAAYDMSDLADDLMRAAIRETLDTAVIGAKSAAKASYMILERPVPDDLWFDSIMSGINHEAAMKSFTGMTSKILSMFGRINQMPKNGLDISISMHRTRQDHGDIGAQRARLKSENDTNTFERHITVQCVNGDMQLVLGCHTVPAGYSIPDMIQDMAGMCRDAGASINLIMLDKEFFSAAILEALDKSNVNYLIPCTDTPDVAKALDEFAAGRRSKVSENHLTESGRRVPYTMIIDERRKKRSNDCEEENPAPGKTFAGFATNDPGTDIFKYHAHTGVKTCHAIMDGASAKTRRYSPRKRLLYTLYFLMIFNGWVAINVLDQFRIADSGTGRKKITKTTIKIILLSTVNGLIY